jgi:two-component system cell cycle response regulator
MKAEKINILIIDENIVDVELIKSMLAFKQNLNFDLMHAVSPDKSFAVLARENIDVVILDLSSSAENGLENLTKFRDKVPDIPVIVLTSNTSDDLALEALKLGAQDYLVKGMFNFDLLVRSLRYSIERNKLRLTLISLAIVDELTSLYNRRGFLTLADNHKKLAKRNKKEFLLCFIDINKLKTINDTFGHKMGDNALKDFSHILRKTFREADIIARLGGDEFVVLIRDAEESKKEILYTRLHDNLNEFNDSENRKYKLSASIGIVLVDPDSEDLVEEILEKADKLMYEDKGSLPAKD